MHGLSKVKLPFTPVRRLFHGAFERTSDTLGKRTRSHSDAQDTDAAVSRRPPPIPAACPSAISPSSPANAYCIALLNDVPADDAVIVTALTTIPFCCHADLLTMPRPQLIGVACSLNAYLPVALHIDLHPARPDAYIRSAIELLVGLRPPAPKPPTRARSLNVRPQESPLARRSLRLTLRSVNEDGDGEMDAEDLPPLMKKRKISPTQSTRSLTELPTPMLGDNSSLRVQSSDAPQEDRSFHVDPAFITTTRPRRRYKPRGFAKMSTPKKGGVKRFQARDKGNESELTFGIGGLSLAVSASELDASV